MHDQPKRRRSSSDDVDDPAQQQPVPKRSRHHNRPEHITRLSDELFLRIASFLDLQALVAFQSVSRRCQRIAIDGQIWKALYHHRFVRPRASRFVGLRKQHQHHYNARNSRWLEDEGISQGVETNWKALYKLRDNWNRGNCGVREINITKVHAEDKPATTEDEEKSSTVMHSDETRENGTQTNTITEVHSPTPSSSSPTIPSLLVKLHEVCFGFCPVDSVCPSVYEDDTNMALRDTQGIVFTVDLTRGLRAWSLRNKSHDRRGSDETQDNLIATEELSSELVGAAPTAMAVDEESDDDGIANVTIGFDTGAFVVYQLDMRMPDEPAAFRTRYIHAATNIQGGNSSAITAMAMLGPYLSIMREQTWTIYDFSRPSRRRDSERGVAKTTVSGSKLENIGGTGLCQAHDTDPSKNAQCRMMPPKHLQAPKILSSLLSRTVWPPLSLSLRRSANRAILLASIVYAFPLYVSGWSVGIQELRFEGITMTSNIAERRPTDTTTTTAATPTCTSRIATAITPGFASTTSARDGSSGLAGSRSQSYPLPQQTVPLARPTSLSYSHP